MGYPDGRVPTGRWRAAARLTALNSAVMVLLLTLADEVERGSTGELFPSPMPFTLPRGNGMMVFEADTLAAGTRRYAGATGKVLSNKTVSEERNDSNIVVRIKLR